MRAGLASMARMSLPTLHQDLLLKYVQRSPHMVSMGLSVEAVSAGRGRLRQPTGADAVGDGPRQRLHPGVTTVLADSACGLAVGAALSTRQPYATLDLRMDHLRPAAPGQDLVCEAECYRLSRSVAFVRAQVWQESPDAPVASAQATFMLGTPVGQRRTRAADSLPAADRASATTAAAGPRVAEPPPRTTPASGWPVPVQRQPVWPGLDMPYARYLGLHTATGADGQALLLMPHQDKLIGNPFLPALHGGVLAGLAESAAMLHLLHHTQGQRLPKGIDFAIDYLRTAGPEDCYAACELLRMGTRVALVQVRVWQPHKGPAQPVAVARGHYLLGPPTEAGAG